MEEINKFLTEAMGLGWHEYLKVSGDSIHIPLELNCGSCGEVVAREPDRIEINNDFSTWQGFGKLWEWARKQDWWNEFIFPLEDLIKSIRPIPRIHLDLINPEPFAKAIYEFLKDRK